MCVVEVHLQPTIDSLLIAPVQRVPRYRLLLQDLLASTATTAGDYHELKDALEEISDTALIVNDTIAAAVERDELLQLENQFTVKPNLTVAGRRLMHQGELRKVTNKKKGASEKFYFHLFNDMIIYRYRYHSPLSPHFS